MSEKTVVPGPARRAAGVTPPGVREDVHSGRPGRLDAVGTVLDHGAPPGLSRPELG